MDHTVTDVQQIAEMVGPTPVSDELTAIADAVEAFERIDARARQRVMSYLRDRYSIEGIGTEGVIKIMGEFFEAIHEHGQGNKQPSKADEKLYGLLAGSRYEPRLVGQKETQ